MIIRGPRRDYGFTVVSNDCVRDRRLSFRARGLLMFLLSQPPDFAVRSEELAAESDGEGRDAVRTALREIESAGYLRRERRQNTRGQWESHSIVYEEPTTEKPSSAQARLLPETADHTDDGAADVGSSGASRSTGGEELEEVDASASPSRATTRRKSSPEADAITREYWESCDRKPMLKFVALRQIVDHGLRCGYDRHEILVALSRCPTYTKGWLETKLREVREQQRRPAGDAASWHARLREQNRG